MARGGRQPLAACRHLQFGPDADPRSLRTRVRVDQYTLIHAIAETEDGKLFSAERYVKAAGGCSAPSTKDPQLAMSRLGQMKLRFEGETPPRSATPRRRTAGQPSQQQRHAGGPGHRIYLSRRATSRPSPYLWRHAGVQADTDISLSEDPVITFGFVPQGAGPMRVDVLDSTQARFHQDFALTGERS